MSWNDCDDGFGAEDWLKWETAPFTVTFKKVPPRFHPARDRYEAQAIFTVEQDGEEKNLGCSKRAYRTLKAFGAQLGQDTFYASPIQCVRTGTGFNTQYIFNVFDASKVDGPPEDANPFVAGQPEDDIPF